MSNAKKDSGPVTTMTLEPNPASNPDPITGAPGSHPVGSEALDPSVEMDYWRVNYMTRPYYKEGRSFGDYEAAYLYGLKNAATLKAMTFEEAEKAHLASGWTAARGHVTYPWADVREAARDSWTRSRR